MRAVIEKGYTTATPIQAQAIPYILMGRDVLGCAQTGTGKTASFTLPMIEILANGRAKARMPRSLVLAPTRELAAQVADNFVTYGKYHKLNMALLIGGETMDEQVRKLDRGVDVVIATPGRMLDLHGRGKVLLSDIKILVIDEADRMLDMGFIPDVERDRRAAAENPPDAVLLRDARARSQKTRRQVPQQSQGSRRSALRHDGGDGDAASRHDRREAQARRAARPSAARRNAECLHIL